MMGKWDFVAALFDAYRDTPTMMTVEDAENDLRTFRAEGWDVPSDLTAEEYADIWNELTKEAQ